MKTAPWFGILLVVLIGTLSFASRVIQPVRAETQPDPAPLQLSACVRAGLTAKCGSLRVPEDRLSPEGRNIDLRVVVIPATSSPVMPDPIFWLAGGPGVAATDDMVGAIALLSPQLQNRDLVFVDQRGTGGSNPLVCEMPDQAVAANPDFSISDYARDCLSTLNGDPRYYTSSVAMDDIDDVRAALGYEQINLYGGSYGATAAQVYLRDHEQHVRSAVLISGSLLEFPMFEWEAHNSQRALDFVFSKCAADARCSTAYPNLRSEFLALLTQLDEQPANLDLVDPVTGAPLPFTSDLLAQVVHSLLMGADTAAELPHLIHEAYSGDLKTFAAFMQLGRQSSLSVMPLVILCFDGWAEFSPEATAQNGASSYYADLQVASAESQAQTCTLLPSAQEQARNRSLSPSALPVLLLNGEADPQDPPSNMAGASQLWSNSRLVVLPNQGHHIPIVPCLKRLIEDFVETASVEGLDTTCLTDFSALQFDISP